MRINHPKMEMIIRENGQSNWMPRKKMIEGEAAHAFLNIWRSTLSHLPNNFVQKLEKNENALLYEILILTVL